MGLTDFRGQVIQAYIDGGWIYYGEVTVNKDPQAQAIRTKARALTFATKNRDSAGTRPALADYLLIFKKARRQRRPDQERRDQRRVDRVGTADLVGHPRDSDPQLPAWPGGQRRAAHLPTAARLHRAVRAALVKPW